jgi:predicted nucleotidyltransferase
MLDRSTRERVLAAAKRHGVSKVRVFGSVARNERLRHSDLDLLVELDAGRTLLDLIGFKQEAEEIFGVRVDVATPQILKPRVRSRALREARPV